MPNGSGSLLHGALPALGNNDDRAGRRPPGGKDEDENENRNENGKGTGRERVSKNPATG